MCGIFGVVTGKTRNPKLSSFVSDAFIASQVRGVDSSGIMQADSIIRNKVVATHKLPVCGSMFVSDKAAKNIIDSAGDVGNITVCHVRAATSGKITLDNAHPFIIESPDGRLDRELVGVHNGTLHSWATHKEAKYYDVDSEWGLSQIYTHGVDAFRNTIKGAFVFAWWDRNEHKILNFALNDQRTMFVTFTDNDDMLFASEAGMLYWLAERNSIKLSEKILQLRSDRHYKFEVGKLSNYTSEELPKFVAAPSSTSTTTTTTTKAAGGGTEYTTMFRVGNILGKYMTGSSEKPSLSRKEVDAARMMELANTKGLFYPVMFVNNGTEVTGTVTLDNGDKMDATIRRAMNLDWLPGDEWKVSVIGIKDDGNNLVAICSKPRIVIVSEKTEAA
jgi:predicted glutamine amidotransferase